MESWRTSIFPTRHPGDTRSLTAISLRKPASKERSWMRDRKSTRLNSSHGYISYAVFCLKKKKQTHNLTESHTYKLPKHTHIHIPSILPNQYYYTAIVDNLRTLLVDLLNCNNVTMHIVSS